MTNPLQIFDISPEQIDRVVLVFYARVRQHAVLAPIFAQHIPDDGWETHEEKVAGFWRNAILKERSYAGSPMRAHVKSQHVQPQHFEDWLALFDEVLKEQLPEDTATAFSALAHRIGMGLRTGLEQMRAPKDEPPVLA